MKPKIITFLLIGCVPLLVWCGDNVLWGHFNTFKLAVYFIAASYIKNPYIMGFCFYAGLWGFATMFFLDPFFLVYIDACTNMLYGIIVYNFICAVAIPQETIFDIICVCVLLQATLGLMQYFGLDPVTFIWSHFANIDKWQAGTGVGTLGNNNYLGAYAAISLPFFIREKWQYAFPIICLCLIISKTTTAVVAAFAALGVFFLGWSGALLGLAFTRFILIFFAYQKTFHFLSVFERGELWRDAIKATSSSAQTLIFGWGPGLLLKKQNNLLHSQYITTFFNFGLIGLAWMGGFIADVFRKHTWKGNALMASFVAILVNMLGNHPMQMVPTAILIITVLALLQKELNFNRA